MRIRSELGNSDQTDLKEGAHLLVVLTGALGDVARGIVVPSLIKQARPDVRLSWLVEDKWRELVELSPSVDAILSYNRKGTYLGVPDLVRSLRASGPFDVALDLQRHFKSGSFTRLSAAPRRIGFSPSDAKEGNWLFQTEYIPPCDMTVSKVYHYKSFVSQLLGTEASKVVFDIDRAVAEKSIEDVLPQKNCRWVCCVLGSSWKSKDWLVTGYQELLNQLLDESEYSVLLAGDKTQLELGSKLETINPERIFSLAGKTTLTQLVGLLSCSSAAFGPDTGSGHIASIVNTPYVGLFGPTDPRRVAPFGSEQLAVTSQVPCRPCKRRVCPGLNNACMRLISPTEVKQQILLASIPSANENP